MLVNPPIASQVNSINNWICDVYFNLTDNFNIFKLPLYELRGAKVLFFVIWQA